MKRIISFLLIMIMAVSVITVFAEEKSDEKLLPTTQQLDDLRDCGIMVGDEDGDLRLDDTITRAEATKMICAIMGLENSELSAKVEVSAFPDVWDTHWAKFYINTAKEAGIVEGDEKGNFNPEADITNEEILKMLICAIGYEPSAEQMGGYPAGYTRTAQRLGLTDGMMLKVNAPAYRGDVAIMFARTLDTPLMMATSWSPDGATYVIADGKNGVELNTLRLMHFSSK